MTGDDCGSKARERKTWLCPCEYLDTLPEWSDQTSMQRELGNAGGRAGAKARERHEKSRKGLGCRGEGSHECKNRNISEYLRIHQDNPHIIKQSSVAWYISFSAGNFSMQRPMICYCAAR